MVVSSTVVVPTVVVVVVVVVVISFWLFSFVKPLVSDLMVAAGSVVDTLLATSVGLVPVELATW